MTDLRDAAADLLHAASERVRRQGHHRDGLAPYPDDQTRYQWAINHLPISGWFALRIDAYYPYLRGDHPPVVELAVELWGECLRRRSEPIELDADGFFDAPATVTAYERAEGRTANQVAETMRVAAALALAADINERKAATANATAQQGSAA